MLEVSGQNICRFVVADGCRDVKADRDVVVGEKEARDGWSLGGVCVVGGGGGSDSAM